jgi:hypothetical protein
VCELGGSLNDTQLQKLENEDKANLGLLERDLLFYVVECTPAFVFPAAMNESDLVHRTKICLTVLIKNSDSSNFLDVLLGAVKKHHRVDKKL